MGTESPSSARANIGSAGRRAASMKDLRRIQFRMNAGSGDVGECMGSTGSVSARAAIKVVNMVCCLQRNHRCLTHGAIYQVFVPKFCDYVTS